MRWSERTSKLLEFSQLERSDKEQTVHGSLARAGKVKSQTPKVEKQDKPKRPQGRAYMRLKYTRRFVNVTLTNGKRKMNAQSA
ncbi:40S ribosomal protein S30-A [Candida parapsilosis]|nr:40S ribosomal protein S30-A [Candida parapsilosis]KAI5906568.1 40S ribosomal protein S30-A [Candida parapsilosis]